MASKSWQFRIRRLTGATVGKSASFMTLILGHRATQLTQLRREYNIYTCCLCSTNCSTYLALARVEALQLRF